MRAEQLRQKVPGWGADRRQEDRPGVPMEREPRRAPEAHWREPEKQKPPDFPVFKRVELKELTPVFGTSVPPRGVSGIMRKHAYRIPEHRPARWLLLLAADRIDVVEGAVLDRKWGVLTGIAALGLGWRKWVGVGGRRQKRARGISRAA